MIDQPKPLPVPPWRLDKEQHRYVNAAHTDIAATFARLGWTPPSVLKRREKEKAAA